MATTVDSSFAAGAGAGDGAGATCAASPPSTASELTGPPSTGRMVPLRAYHRPHALHSERTPFGPRRMSGVACDVHPQLEHARPFRRPPASTPRPLLGGAGGAGGGSWGSTGSTFSRTRRASSAATHATASLTFAAPLAGVAATRLPSRASPHCTRWRPSSSTQARRGSWKRVPTTVYPMGTSMPSARMPLFSSVGSSTAAPSETTRTSA